MLIEKVGVPGTQGAGITGTQGAGVGTPAAAAVAAITAGFVGELHIPKGGILAMGAKSAIVAAGFPSIMVGELFLLSYLKISLEFRHLDDF